MRKGWKRRPFGPHRKGWVYFKQDLNAGTLRVMAIGKEHRLRWFISRGLMEMRTAAGNVRFFLSPDNAMRVADRIARWR